jgi:hypothetical protein
MRLNSTLAVLIVLLLVYAGVVILLHRMQVESTPSGLSSKVTYVQNPFGNAPRGTYGVASTNVTLFPAPTQWKNNLVEDRHDLYQDGIYLWEYTDLPSWMKGTKTTNWMVYMEFVGWRIPPVSIFSQFVYFVCDRLLQLAHGTTKRVGEQPRQMD